MLDIRADIVYMVKELADKVVLVYTKEKDYVNRANAKRLPMEGVA